MATYFEQRRNERSLDRINCFTAENEITYRLTRLKDNGSIRLEFKRYADRDRGGYILRHDRKCGQGYSLSNARHNGHTRNRNDRRYSSQSRTPSSGTVRPTYFRTISVRRVVDIRSKSNRLSLREIQNGAMHRCSKDD